jgi:plasmid maintenance system antidote protein VapI
MHERRGDLSQRRAAELAGISRNEWNQMETGRRGIGPTNAARLAKVLGGEPEEYLTRASHPAITELRSRIHELEARVGKLERHCVPGH